MEKVYLKDLLDSINCEHIYGKLNSIIKGVSINSKTIKNGEVYFAICGNKYDGHDFINESINNGASVIVYSKNNIYFDNEIIKKITFVKTNNTIDAIGSFAKKYRMKFNNVKIIAITGSNGKTTTKEILSSILNINGKTVFSKGNFNNKIGVPLSIFDLTFDTKYAVFEIGTSLNGEISELSNIVKPNIAVITNIGFSHLKSFISLKCVFKEKKQIFNYVKKNGFIIINNNDKFLKNICVYKDCKKITFSFNETSDVYAKNVTLYRNKTIFDLFFKKEFIRISIKAIGKFNIENVLAAASCAFVLNFSLSETKKGIENFVLSKMRMETFIASNGIILINDSYNANPSSVKKSIESVIEIYNNKKINLVLGDMLDLGVKSLKHHYNIGKFINKQNINYVTLFGYMVINIKNIIKKKVFYSNNEFDILQNLKSVSLDIDCVFLFKASRNVHLENIFYKFYDFLQKKKRIN
jgi:UDP-N-acetylmuramoyl-tripeptide--D-alanyl-D-alanine ligase